MRQIGRAVIAAGKCLEALGYRFGVTRSLWRLEKMKRLEAASAGFQHIMRGQWQALAPADRIGIVKIGDEPEDGQDFAFRALLAVWQISPENCERKVGIVMRPAGDIRDRADHSLNVADRDLGHDRRQRTANLFGFRVDTIRVFAEAGNDQLAFASKRCGEPVDVFGMRTNRCQIG